MHIGHLRRPSVRDNRKKKGTRVIKVCCRLSFLRCLAVCLFAVLSTERSRPRGYGRGTLGEARRGEARRRVLSWLRAPREVGDFRESGYLSTPGRRPGSSRGRCEGHGQAATRRGRLPGWSRETGAARGVRSREFGPFSER